MQTMPPPDVAPEQTAALKSAAETGQAPVPPPSGKKLQRRQPKLVAAEAAPPVEPEPITPCGGDALPSVAENPVTEPNATPPPEASSSATPWQMSRTFGPGVEIRATGDRIRATIHLVRTRGEGDPFQRVMQQRQEIRDRLTAKVQAHVAATPAFTDFTAVRSQFQAHQQAAQLAKATAEELAARRKRLALSNEANLAEQLQAIDRELEGAAAALATAEKAVTTLAPIVEQRRALAEREAAKAIDPAVGEVRNELKAKENEALAALMMANTALLDDLVVYDSLLRSFANGAIGAKDLAHVFGE